MSKHGGLKIFFMAISLFMVGVAVWTSLQSNLWTEWRRLVREPWMVATLIDFYFNVLIISLWVVYREAWRLKTVVWILSFIVLGSIATAFYIFLQFYRLKPEDSLDYLLMRKK